MVIFRIVGAISIAKMLTVNSSLSLLLINKHEIKDEAAIAITNTLEMNSSLNSLVLSEIDIRMDGTQSFAETLRLHSSLVTLIVEQEFQTHFDALKCSAVTT